MSRLRIPLGIAFTLLAILCWTSATSAATSRASSFPQARASLKAVDTGRVHAEVGFSELAGHTLYVITVENSPWRGTLRASLCPGTCAHPNRGAQSEPSTARSDGKQSR